ncbi:MAG: ABC transporter ATP-binding protein [Anaerolineales bacterium]|nr:ABC transporter ATP-binding protein [Anaerolineales bacterium]MBP6207791.1 ABC transporter ATP-binding protein [Anaerolineales bacterium]
MTEPVISVQNLTRRFGEFVAVDHINFNVNKGEIVGYLGPNGSGKTTTIRMLLGLLQPSDGKATVLGYDVFKQSEEVRKRVGYMSQKFAIYDDLTTLENLTFYGGVYGITDKSRILHTLELVGLKGHERTLTRDMSTGWRQRLSLGIALVHEPQLLFLDEPTSGVDPTARRAFWDLIYELAEGGVTILVTTHYMDEAEYCERVGVMRDGKLLAMDTPTNLKKSIITGNVWEVFAQPLEQGLELLVGMDGVDRVGLAGDHLRVISQQVGKDALQSRLSSENIRVEKIVRGEPTLEDVFLALAR